MKLTSTLAEPPAGQREASLAAGPSPGAGVLRGALAMLSTQPVTWGITLLVVVLVPRYLGSGGLGQFAAASVIGSLVATVASLGVPNYLMRQLAVAPDRTRMEASGALALVVSASAVLATAVGLLLFALRPPSLNLTVTLFALLGSINACAGSVLFSALVGRERHARFAWTQALIQVMSGGAGIGVLVLGGDVVGYAGVTALTSLGGSVVAWYASGLGFDGRVLDPRSWRPLAIGGFPFVVWNVAQKIRAQIDVVLVGALLQPAAAGLLAAAYRIINLAVFIPTVITIPLLPALSRIHDDEVVYRATLGRSITAVLLLEVPISATIFALAPSIPGFLGWPLEFSKSSLLMMILAFGQPLMGVDMVLGASLFALRRERAWLRVMIVAAVFNPVTNLVAIPLFDRLLGNGAAGAGFVEISTELIMFAGALRLTPSRLLGPELVGRVGRICVAGATLVAVAWALRTTSAILAATAGGLAYAVAVVLLGLVGPTEIRDVARTLRRAPATDVA